MTDTTNPQQTDEPTPLRWGLNDVMWGDDDTVTVLLSGPDGEPYWLELDPERAAVLREDLAGPDGEAAPTDQTALRDRIADALADAEGWQWAPGFDKSQSPTYQHYLRQADALTDLLPPPTDRIAILRTEAEHLIRDLYPAVYDDAGQKTALGVNRAARELLDRADADELRRLATAASGPGGVAGETQQPETQLPYIHVDDDGDQLDIGAVMASTYDSEAPVVYLAADQHQGDQVATVYVRPERVDEVITALHSARQAAEALAAAVSQPDGEA